MESFGGLVLLLLQSRLGAGGSGGVLQRCCDGAATGGRPAGQPAAGGRAGKEEAPMLLLKGEGRPGQGGGATQPGKGVARASMVEMMSPWPGILVMAQGEAAVAEGD